jgi:hypothetical protein
MNVSSAYQVLELQQTATSDEVNSSYRRLLKLYHPDRNAHRSDWSHKMTVRLTEAYHAVSDYIKSLQDSSQNEQNQKNYDEELDSGYSVSTQMQIGNIYGVILDQLDSYYTRNMDNVYLRQEGTLRQHYRVCIRKFGQVIEDLSLTADFPGSTLQHSQVKTIKNFASAFYEFLLIKPKNRDVFTSEDLKAKKLYDQGSRALDQAISRGLIHMERKYGLICPDHRKQAEKSFMFLLTNYPKCSFVPETLIKTYLLKSLSELCEYIEETF